MLGPDCEAGIFHIWTIGTQPHAGRYIDWIGQEFQWEEYHYLEMWRFYQSGQFIHHCWHTSSDWYDRNHYWPANDAWQLGAILGIGDTIFRFTEIFEFA